MDIERRDNRKRDLELAMLITCILAIKFINKIDGDFFFILINIHVCVVIFFPSDARYSIVK